MPRGAVTATRSDEAELYRRHHRDLQRAVSRVVTAPPELIEDACQNAWTMLLLTKPNRASVFGWLCGVATREAYRLRDVEHRYAGLETMRPGRRREAALPAAFCIEEFLEVRDALVILASLPDRQREDLALLVAGFSYDEIAAMTGGRTFSTVRRNLVKAHAGVRLARARGG